jgi:site-specific DNA-methyltransferase (adenine-specific)
MSLTILQGDWIEQLRALPDESVQCCVTSPPYWGLRDYGTATWDGGDAACDHKQGRPGAGRADGVVDDRGQRNRDGVGSMVGDCGKCGAKRIDAQLGLEKTPEEYVAKMVAGFREVRRVLRNDGTLWLNLGDSYCSQGGLHDGREDNQPGVGAKRVWRDGCGRADGIVDERGQRNRNGNAVPGLKLKDLIGIPWLVAFAMRSDGWYLRSDIIWAKPNPMPESVTDRPTKSHEYLFLMSKLQTYFYDHEAIKESKAQSTIGDDRNNENGARRERGFPGSQSNGGTNLGGSDGNRNKRSVWTVTTSPYPEAHFATYPPALIKPCILAGSKAGDTVLDPFGGSGTTGMVALELGRRAILCELNPEYIKLIRQRCDVTPGFAL